MRWNLVIDPDSNDNFSKSITVEADDWHTALARGLERYDGGGALLSNLSSDIDENGAVTVTDAVSRRVYRLHPYERAQLEGADEKLPPEALPRHKLFFSKDAPPEEPSGIHFIERLYATTERLTRVTATRLVEHYFEALKAVPRVNGERYFISLQVYDHEFESRPKRPAVAALTWKEWQQNKPTVNFPLSGDEGITFSKLPPPHEAPPSDIESAASSVVEKGMIAAFEKMQGIFQTRNHADAARFITDLTAECIPAGGMECLLVSPDTYEFYVAATAGSIPEDRIGAAVSMVRGLTGFAAGHCVVLRITDPGDDNRFEAESDLPDTTVPKTILIAPMQFEGETVGLLRLFDKKNGLPFSQAEANILSYIGSAFAEFATVSLPSRQPDFTDMDFAAPVEKVPSVSVGKTRAPAEKPVGDKTAKPPAENPENAPQSEPEKPPKEKAGGSKKKKTKKRRKKKGAR